jgi:hypothetical protein
MISYMSSIYPYNKKEIFITIDGRLPEEDTFIVKHTLEDIFRKFEGLAEVTIPRTYFYGSPCKDEYLDLSHCYHQYIIETSRDQNGIDLTHIFNLTKREPLQRSKPHYEIFIVDDYINAGRYSSDHIIYGFTLSAISNGHIFNNAGTILSIKPLKELYGPKWPMAFYVDAIHDFGHLFGLPNEKSPYYIDHNHPYAKKSPLYINHCSHEYCAMGLPDVGERKDLLDLARDVLGNNPNWYCYYDLQELIKNLKILFS